PETVSNAGDQPPGTVSIHQHIQFTGRRYSTATGLFFNRNRYYSPQVGRFVSRDPIGFNGGNNLWGYANNNPICFSDPSGKGIFEALQIAYLEIWKTQSENTIQSENIQRLLRQVQKWIRDLESRDPCNPEIEKLRGLETELSNAIGSLGGTLSINQAKRAIERGQAPRSMDRADSGKIPGEQDHIHFNDGSAINIDGSWKHGSRNLTNEEKKFLKKFGFNV
ncbi:MAG: RHS repeat-associated core domain-containing protein, partial [Candidatus Riflebacteria bacterium]|nr:RHS repeat-associated core domain-containing protein [Candidatus Riflebacteria bacterium]